MSHSLNAENAEILQIHQSQWQTELTQVMKCLFLNKNWFAFSDEKYDGSGRVQISIAFYEIAIRRMYDRVQRGRQFMKSFVATFAY